MMRPVREIDRRIDQFAERVGVNWPKIRPYVEGEADIGTVPSRWKNDAIKMRRAFERKLRLMKEIEEELPAREDLPAMSPLFKRALRREETR
jgi:hypothetical protein